MSHVPGWWTLLLLALAAYRMFRLIAADSILDRPRDWILRASDIQWEIEDSDGTWAPTTQPLTQPSMIPNPLYRERLDMFIHCPWCLGFWLALGWWAAWIIWPHATLIAATPWVISAIVGLVVRNLDP